MSEEDFPWAHIGGHIPVETLRWIVEEGAAWATYGNVKSDQNFWHNGWQEANNRLAQKLNHGSENE